MFSCKQVFILGRINCIRGFRRDLSVFQAAFSVLSDFSALSVALVVYLQAFFIKYFVPNFVHYLLELTFVSFRKAEVFYF